MEILTAEEIRKADRYTIENEPIPSIDLMERAATHCFTRIRALFSSRNPFFILAGPGNNGGDGAVIARHLVNAGYTVTLCIVRFTKKTSPDLDTNLEILQKFGKSHSLEIIEGKKKGDIPDFPEGAVLIDALFGTGLSRPAKGLAASAIHKMNEARVPVVSIDSPSGLFSEDNGENIRENIVKATYTFTFQTPKLSFLFPENAPYLGQWEVIPIGMDEGFIKSLDPDHYLLDDPMVGGMLKERPKFSHKGTYGHSLLICGSYGKVGAGVLAAKGCLKGGTGLLTVRVPACGYGIVQTSVPEALCDADEEERHLKDMQPQGGAYTAIGVGPGIGTDNPTQRAFKVLIQNAPTPLVLDADALNILAENKTWIPFLPPGSVLTPHPGEFRRLVGPYENDHHKYTLQREFARKHQAYLVLKEAHTSIACPDGKVYFNNTGNPGMATGGSGDVLTGMITGLMAQGYSSRDAAILGVYLHGLAGDLAMDQHGVEAMTAMDIVGSIGAAFGFLRERIGEGASALPWRN